ncbi:MAG: amidohydrolase [Mycobacterium sp.]|nr:amidohydrolase [Mycobacterium sp.]
MAADVVFVNAKFTTLDAEDSQAEAVAVTGGRFSAVGTRADVEKLAGPKATVVDLKGARVVPGLIDAHCHPIETLWMKDDWVDARFPGTDSVAATVKKIGERAKKTKKGDWIFVACVSASENKFKEKRLPTRAEMDGAAPDNPVILGNGTHMAIVNSAALTALAIKKGQTKLPKGGTVLLDDDGEPTGVITDGFADIPSAPQPSEVAGYISKGIPEFWNAHGYTSVLAITPHQVVPALQAVSATLAQPNLRYSVSVWAAPDGKGFPDTLTDFEMPAKADPDYFKFVGIKAWVDGENDCRTGYMYQPYLGHLDIDPPGGRGTLVTPQDDANAFADLAHSNNRIAMLHCSGDAAVDIGLGAYEHSATTGKKPDTIRRIEHFGMFQLTDSQIERAKKLIPHGLRISVQPIWLTELVKADNENMGPERTKTGFKFKTLIEAGLEPAASTDMTGIYLGNVEPFIAMQAMVTRGSDAGVFEPQEAIPVLDALRMFTIWPARAIGEAEHRGSIEVGKLADMTVLTDDLLSVTPETIHTVAAAQTIVGGRVVYSRD